MNHGTYLAMNQEKVRRESKRIEVRYDYLLLILLGLVVGQAEIADGMFPLALTYWAMLASINNWLLIGVTITTGIGFFWSGAFSGFIYLMAGVLGYIFYQVCSRKIREADLALSIALFYVSLAVLNHYIHNALVYRYFLSFAEGIFIYLVNYLGVRGIKELLKREQSVGRLGYLSLMIIISSVLIGLSNINLLPLMVINIIVVFIICASSFAAGLSTSVIISVILGMILLLGGIIPIITVLKYIIFSLTTGIFANRHRFWVAAGGIIGFMLYSGFSPTLFNLMNTLIEIGIALLVFLLVPVKIYENIFDSLRTKIELQVENYPEVSGKFREQMTEIKKVFEELSATFNEKVPEDIAQKKLDDFAFIIKNKLCNNCHYKKRCWQENRKSTLGRLKKLIDSGKRQGKLSKETITRYMGDYCISNQAVAGIKNSFEILQINSFWRERLNDKQQIVSEQLLGVSEMINRISASTELTVGNSSNLSNYLIKNGKERGLDLCSVHANYNSDSSRVDLVIRMEPCSGNSPCEEQLLNFISSRFGHHFRIIDKKCGNILKDEPCYIHYGPAGRYCLNRAVVQKAMKADVSGDSILYKALKNGKDLLVISDGMGVGEKASRESKAAINLLDSLINAGFDQGLAIKTINSALYLRNQEESFTTLDIGIFDTFTGRMTFNKIGAVSSYIKREWELIKIASASLPVGILDRIEISSQELELQAGDFVIMFTDGLLDIRTDLEDKEEWLQKILRNSFFDKPEDMAAYIMDVVLDGKRDINDDLTLVVFKIEELYKKRRKTGSFSRINH